MLQIKRFSGGFFLVGEPENFLSYLKRLATENTDHKSQYHNVGSDIKKRRFVWLHTDSWTQEQNVFGELIPVYLL
jgi:hypothetical protein